MRRFQRAALTLSLAALAGCASSDERHFLASVRGKPAPDFTLKSLEGEEVMLKSFRGKPVLLTFWAAG